VGAVEAGGACLELETVVAVAVQAACSAEAAPVVVLVLAEVDSGVPVGVSAAAAPLDRVAEDQAFSGGVEAVVEEAVQEAAYSEVQAVGAEVVSSARGVAAEDSVAVPAGAYLELVVEVEEAVCLEDHQVVEDLVGVSVRVALVVLGEVAQVYLVAVVAAEVGACLEGVARRQGLGEWVVLVWVEAQRDGVAAQRPSSRMISLISTGSKKLLQLPTIIL